MAAYTMVVMTNAKPGRDREFNDWYTNVHLPEVCQVPGIKAARRFEHSRSLPEGGPETIQTGTKYLALYEIETDDIDSVVKGLMDSAATMTMSDSLEMRAYAEFFKETAIYPR